MIKLRDADGMGCDELAGLPVEAQRQLYRSYRRSALYLISRSELQAHFDRVKPVRPSQWIEAVRAATGVCDRCSGRGTYYWGACVNGKMSHSAPCARCGGNGRVTVDDCRRAYAYDNHAMRRACAV